MRDLQVLDLFCGAGGTSTGAIEAATACGFRPQLTAINHWPVAIETHAKNHPDARHLCTGVDQVNPRELYRKTRLDVMWASPECTHHSVARGGKPINDQSRATAWCVSKFADQLMPPVILVENVPEFQTWGPLKRVRAKDREGRGRWDWQPIPERKGEIFKAWVATLSALGYTVDWRVLCAADYGDPTTRRRLFVQAVRGKRKVVWPEPTHGPGRAKPWVPAASVIDWSLPCPSIFERKKALKPNTLRRIFRGLEKFGLGEFMVCMEHGGSLRSTERPLPTVTCARGGAIGVAKPMLIELRGTSEAQLDDSARSIEEPLPTITAGGGHLGLVRLEAAILPQHTCGRLRPVSEPLPTITTTARGVGLVKPFLVSYYGNGGALSVDEPLATVTSKERFGLVRPVIEIKGKRYQLDIGFRMLQPHELAMGQGFREGYLFTGTKTEAVEQIGNAVPRRLARALLTAALTQRADVSWLPDFDSERTCANG